MTNKKGVDINAKGNYGWTALIYASVNGSLDIVKNLIKQGADINAQDDYDGTALMYASIEGYLEIVKYLIDNGADVNTQDDYGETALMYASRRGYFRIIEYLIKNGADVNIKNNKNETALIKVIISCIRTFEENKENMIKKNAALNRCLKIVKCLIENSADVNIKNNEGKPL